MVQAHHVFSFSDYVRLEEDAGVRHEFFEGAVWAMAGGTPEHAALAVNTSTLLNLALESSPCRVYSSDLRVRILATGLATYPDVTVVCGDPQIDPEDTRGQTVTNPRLVVEVLSPSTQAYDRGKKLEHYKRCQSLEVVVLIASDERRIEVWSRGPEGWAEGVSRGDATATIDALSVVLPLDRVYRDLVR